MPADKLGKYMTSSEFLRRANEAVTKSVADLEAKGIKPAYITRPSKLGQYITSPEFERRVQQAVEQAVTELETKGLKPVYDPDPPTSDVGKTPAPEIKAKQP
jgi:hypothetical protein